MQKSTQKWQFIFFAAAVLVAATLYIMFIKNTNEAVVQKIQPAPEFGVNNYNIIKTDTFVALIQGAYGNFATHKIEGNTLEVTIKNANELTKDFFNGNDALLQYKMGDYGFAIKYNPEEPSVVATFKINEQRGVPVPNDVLIKLMDKTNKTENVDYTK